jgi:predicted transposase YbfD/YdcC
MDADAPRDLFGCFDELPDPRVERTRVHRLDDIIALAIMAVICGAEGWVDVANFGRDKLDWLKTLLHLPHGIPSHDTFGRVFAMLEPEAFERCFLTWVESLIQVSGQRVLHIDGKTLRGSFDTASSTAAIHMVSVWASKSELALAQVTTDVGGQKSNEITAIPRLLDLISLHGAIVTIDAIGCQTKIAELIIKGGGDYILAVKDNQPTLHEDIKLLLDEAITHQFEGMGYDYDEQVEKGHGRIETRRVWVTRDVDWLRQRGQWEGLRSVICVESVRQVLDPAGGPAKVTTHRRYYITSLDHRQRGQDAAFFASLVRAHWSIENQLHWSLDVAFAEDECRVRQGHAAENLARLRRIALNLLKKEKSSKRGLAGKRLRAGWSQDYLLKVLGLTN